MRSWAVKAVMLLDCCGLSGARTALRRSLAASFLPTKTTAPKKTIVSRSVYALMDGFFESNVDFERAYQPHFGEYLSEEWFKARQRVNVISASRLAAALGLEASKSVAGAWRERLQEIKVEQPVRLEQNYHMRRGVLAEPVLIEYLRVILEPHGCKVLSNTGIFQHPDYPHFSATPDGFVIFRDGSVFPLEIKCPEHISVDKVGIPVRYGPQLITQMCSTGARGCFFFECSPTDGYRLLCLHRFELLQWFIDEVVKESVEEFVACLREEREPPRFNGRSKFIADCTHLFNLCTQPLLHYYGSMFEIVNYVDTVRELIIHGNGARVPVPRRSAAIDYEGVPAAEELKLKIKKGNWCNKK